MKTRLILAFALLAITAGFVQAQTLEGVHLHLVRPGQEFGGVLIGPNKPFPASTVNDTFYLPPGGGTLLTSAAAGWQVGGQGLLPTNPGLLGTTDAADVTLIAGGLGAANQRLTLLAGTDAVLLPTQTALRFGDAAGAEYVALVSPATNKTAGYTFVLPDSLPGGEDVRLKVNTIVGTTVTLGYTNPNTTGQIGFRGNTAASCNASNVNTVAVTGMTFQVNSNSIYSFEAIVEVDNAFSNADITWGNAADDTQDGAISVLYRLFQLSGNGNPPGGLDADDFTVLTAGETYILKGYIQTGVLGTDPFTLQLRVRRQGGGAQTCITAKSAVQLISE